MQPNRTAVWTARVLAIAVLLVIAVVLATLTTHTVAASRADSRAGTGSPAAAASDAGFEAGDIISDDSFFNADAMTQQGIQQWLLAMPCTPKGQAACLAFYRQDTATRPANANCLAYRGARQESAAAIFFKVAQACGINPRVLLVLVQKEQSLVTHPSIDGYQRATGYACPDTAACDTKYYGFFNQLYSAAWQFREYTHEEDHWPVHPGLVKVQYAPDAACGSSLVRIADQATADLYLYTPYQPDAATLAHPDSASGHCSSFGNLNFFRLYTSWFGDPRATRFPEWWGPCLDNVGGLACRVEKP